MSKLSRDDVLKLASLSRLKLTSREVESLQSELTEILDYVKILDKVDTSGLEPTYQVSGLVNQNREDELVDYQASPEDLLKISKTKDNQYQVKRVL